MIEQFYPNSFMYFFILLQIKAGDVRVLANTSFILVKKDWSSEIRLHAFKMLQVCISTLPYQAFNKFLEIGCLKFNCSIL